MVSWTNMDELEIIEALASWEDMIDSEDALSERFDQDMAPSIVEAYGEDDEVAINEGFSDWADGLVSDGELHPTQYNQYGYTGKYSS